MSYERKDIPALIEAFKAAREVLVEKITMHYLCHALDALKHRGYPLDVVRRAKNLVSEAIEHSIALGGYYNYDDRYPTTANGERQIRIRWCDKIIADLQEYAK